MLRRAIAICHDGDVLEASESALAHAGFHLIRSAAPQAIRAALPFMVSEAEPSSPPELIILDLDLPREGAADVLHSHLLKLFPHPWIANQPLRPALVLVSSSENLGLLREGFVVPEFQLLIKPLGEDEMQDAVNRASRRARQALSRSGHRGI